jgi:hypothetical protein
MYTLCKITKTFSGQNEEQKAAAERCMELAAAGCDTEFGSCRAIINCVVAAATRDAGAPALPCSLAVLNGINLIAKFSVEPGLGWATMPNMVACMTEQAQLCAEAAG